MYQSPIHKQFQVQSKLSEVNRKTIGNCAETVATSLILKVGMQVLQRNWRCNLGEVDIVALDGETLVFCEVKARRKNSAYPVRGAVDKRKMIRIARLAKAYLFAANVPPSEVSVRFDIVRIEYSLRARKLEGTATLIRNAYVTN